MLLNITGGGRSRLARDYSRVPAEPTAASRKSFTGDAVRQVAALCGVCKRHCLVEGKDFQQVSRPAV